MPTKSKGKYKWSKKEIEEFLAMFQITPNKELAEYFGVGWRTIVRKARELKLQKHPDFRILIDFYEHGKKGAEHPKSIETRFKIGEHVSPETEFKPGHESFYQKMSILERLRYQTKKKYKKSNNL